MRDATPAPAADINWVGYQGCAAGAMAGSWDNGDNWYGYVVPGPSDRAIFDVGFDPGGLGMPRDVYFGDFCLNQFPCPNPVYTPAVDAQAYSVVIPKWDWNFHLGSGGWYCSPPTTTSGTLHIVNNLEIGQSDGPAEVVLRDGNVDSAIFRVGSSHGQGTFTLINATLHTNWLGVGEGSPPLAEGYPGSWGQVIVAGPSAAIVRTDATVWHDQCIGVGAYNEGSLSIINGGSVSLDVGNHFIGRDSGTGHLHLAGGSHFDCSLGSCFVGGCGNGDAVVEDSGTDWIIGNNFIVGQGNCPPAGTGAVTIRSGAVVESRGHSHVADGAGTFGSVIIRDPGTRWETTNALRIGYSGDGQVHVADAAVLTTGLISLGYQNPGRGEMSVEGTGSLVECIGGANWTANLNVGFSGRGVLRVSSGATVTAAEAIRVGVNSGSSGDVTITDAGTMVYSKWIQVGSSFSDSGAVHLNTGSIARADSAFQILRSGRIDGDGTIEGRVVNLGEMSPGSGIGTLTIRGTYQQDSTGVLIVELGGAAPGSTHDQIAIDGEARLDGMLAIDLVGGFVPDPGDEFEIMLATSVTGRFSSVEAAGFTAHVSYLPDRVVLVAGGETAVPPAAPGRLILYPCRPNPFNPATTIRYELPADGHVRLTVFDVAGRRVRRLVDANQQKGMRSSEWDGRDDSGQELSSGTYLTRFEFDGHIEAIRMQLVR
ncbi:MAG: FlgD immunoglobulin-like domain containing protein [Deltaproteobacteria bacterium]|nr:FlgD immunoglobulin-like domain containing protein [Deltaproteobacteria bacterium]